MKKIFKETKAKFLSEEKYLYSLSALIVLAGLGLLVWFGFSFFNKSDVVEETQTSFKTVESLDKSCEFRRILDGVCVESKEQIDPKLVAVMVENHFDARPQSGISKASIVYEAPVEGNYSRFMLIYPLGEEISKVGPVRSARPYYLDWLSEYSQIMYMHVGGSPDALQLIKKFDIFDLNEFYRGWYYWRSDDRYAPHNVYTSSKLWEDAWEEYGEDMMQDADVSGTEPTDNVIHNLNGSGWKFENGEACTENCVDEITVTLRAPVYEAVWKYVSSTDNYARYQMGKLHTDQDGTVLVADTIAVQYVETQVLDGVGRLGMDTIGEGRASVYVHGKEIRGNWKKNSRTERTRFYDESGLEIAFKSGKIWVEVVNQIGGVETSADKIED